MSERKTKFSVSDREKLDNCLCMRCEHSTYEVTTHFNADGKQSVLQQFKELILSNNLI